MADKHFISPSPSVDLKSSNHRTLIRRQKLKVHLKLLQLRMASLLLVHPSALQLLQLISDSDCNRIELWPGEIRQKEIECEGQQKVKDSVVVVRSVVN